MHLRLVGARRRAHYAVIPLQSLTAPIARRSKVREAAARVRQGKARQYKVKQGKKLCNLLCVSVIVFVALTG